MLISSPSPWPSHFLLSLAGQHDSTSYLGPVFVRSSFKSDSSLVYTAWSQWRKCSTNGGDVISQFSVPVTDPSGSSSQLHLQRFSCSVLDWRIPRADGLFREFGHKDVANLSWACSNCDFPSFITWPNFQVFSRLQKAHFWSLIARTWEIFWIF